MPRTYRRKTTRGDIPCDVMLRAVKEVLINKRSCRGVAADCDIKPTTRRRYCTMNQEKTGWRTRNEYRESRIF